MTPDEREATAVPRPRGLGHTPRQRVTPLGGIGRQCGCRYARIGGVWLHVTPCRAHVLAQFPIADDTAQELITSA